MSGHAIPFAETDGWVQSPAARPRQKPRKPRFKTKEDAEKDRKFRTGIVVKKKTGFGRPEGVGEHE